MYAIEKAFRVVYEGNSGTPAPAGDGGNDGAGGGADGGYLDERQGGRGEELASLEGNEIIDAARNVSFSCLHGRCKTDRNAEIILTYKLVYWRHELFIIIIIIT